MQPNPEVFESQRVTGEVEADPATVAALRFQDLYQSDPQNKEELNIAFSEVVNITYPMLWHELLGRGIKEDAAQDVLQNTYLKAFKALSEGKFEGRSKVSTWLYRGLFNNRYNYQAAERRRRDHELYQEELEGFEVIDTAVDVEETVLNDATGRAMEDNIQDILTQLNISSRDKKVWTLRNEGLHFAEIAAGLGITAVAARVCYHRVRRKIESRYTA